jgi:hypothetical protein
MRPEQGPLGRLSRVPDNDSMGEIGVKGTGPDRSLLPPQPSYVVFEKKEPKGSRTPNELKIAKISAKIDDTRDAFWAAKRSGNGPEAGKQMGIAGELRRTRDDLRRGSQPPQADE